MNATMLLHRDPPAQAADWDAGSPARVAPDYNYGVTDSLWVQAGSAAGFIIELWVQENEI